MAKANRAAPSGPPEERTERIEVSAARAYAAATTLPPDIHRIAPHEEVVLDASALRARFASTDEAHIAAALDAHELSTPSPAPPPAMRSVPALGRLERHEPTHRVRRRAAPRAPMSVVWVLTLAALGLAAGIGVALVGN